MFQDGQSFSEMGEIMDSPKTPSETFMDEIKERAKSFVQFNIPDADPFERIMFENALLVGAEIGTRYASCVTLDREAIKKL